MDWKIEEEEWNNFSLIYKIYIVSLITVFLPFTLAWYFIDNY